MLRPRLIHLAVVAVMALSAAGCGGSSGSAGDPNAPEVNPAGDIPDNQAFVPYTPPGARFSVKVPEGWSRRSRRGAVTFTDKLNAIRMESMAAPAALTVAEAQRVELPRLQRSVQGFEAGKVSSVQRRAGRATEITYLADAAPNQVTGKSGQDAVERYVFFHRGARAVLTLSGPKGADNVDPWRIVTDSLHWTR